MCLLYALRFKMLIWSKTRWGKLRFYTVCVCVCVSVFLCVCAFAKHSASTCIFALSLPTHPPTHPVVFETLSGHHCLIWATRFTGAPVPDVGLHDEDRL